MRCRLAFMSILALATSTASAQVAGGSSPPERSVEGAGPSDSRIGIGASYSPGSLAIIYVPADLLDATGAPDVRWEPEFGLSNRHGGVTPSTTWQLGLGIFGLGKLLGGVQGSGGGRLQYRSEEVDGTRRGAFRLLGAIGGEWAPLPSVSIGVEAQLGFALGWDQQPGAGRQTTRELATGALVILRLFPP